MTTTVFERAREAAAESAFPEGYVRREYAEVEREEYRREQQARSRVLVAGFIAEIAGPGRDWVARAACRGTGHARFYVEDGETPRQAAAKYDAARAVCDQCPVQSECVEYALKKHDRFGLWGRTTPTERAEMQQERRAS